MNFYPFMYLRRDARKINLISERIQFSCLDMCGSADYDGVVEFFTSKELYGIRMIESKVCKRYKRCTNSLTSVSTYIPKRFFFSYTV